MECSIMSRTRLVSTCTRCLRLLSAILILFICTVSTQDIRLPPSITHQPVAPPKNTFRPGTTIRLRCEAIGFPTPTFEWMFNNDVLDFNARRVNIKYIGNTKAGNGSMEIIEAGKSDEGLYQCKATNQYGSTLSKKINLIMATLSTTTSGNSPDIPYEVTEGNSLKIDCQKTYKSVPPPEFSWALAKTRIDTSPRAIDLDKRVMIDDEGNLFFAYTLIQDQTVGEMLYKCNTFNSILDQTTGGSYSTLKVKPNPDVRDRRPSLLFARENRRALIGEDITLQCIFEGRPAPNVIWRRKNFGLPIGRNKQSGTELTIYTVEQADEGDYECQAINSAGDSVPQTVQIDVQSRPSFVEKPMNLNVTVGETAVIHCVPAGEPLPARSWFVNGVQKDPSTISPRYTLSNNGNTLSISDVCKDCPNGSTDLTNIQCEIKNEHGDLFASSYINVLFATEITAGPSNITIEYYNKGQLTCQAKSDDSTPVSYSWKREGEALNLADNRYSQLPDGTLEINTENEKDGGKGMAGKFTCHATNGYSSADASSYLSFPAGEPPAPVLSGIGDMIWIIIGVAIFLFILILLLLCCLCLQRNKGETYPVDEKERANGNDPEKELIDGGFHDYQRPEDEPIKGSRASLNSSIKLDSDDDDDLNEYGDIDTGKFNEDGSFIGQYISDKKKRLLDSTV